MRILELFMTYLLKGISWMKKEYIDERKYLLKVELENNGLFND